MKIILVTGLEKIDKDSIIKLALESFASKSKSDFSYVNFDDLDIVKHGLNSFGSVGGLKELFIRFHDELDKELMHLRRANPEENLILNGYFSINSDFGYVPIITERFFATLKPDLIVILETPPFELSSKEDEIMEMAEQQDINRSFAVRHASSLGCPLKIVSVKKGNISDVVKQMQALFHSVSE